MGTTSQKLEYLNGTKNSLKTAINNLGGAIDSNTTFRNYATQLDTIYSNLPKVSGTGTSVTLSPTLKGRLGSVIGGNTSQKILPDGYTQVDYIQSDGNQYIDTEVTNNDSWELQLKMAWTEFPTNLYSANGINNNMQIGATKNGKWTVNGNDSNYSITTNQIYNAHCYQSTKSLYVDNVLTATRPSISYSNANIYLFAYCSVPNNVKTPTGFCKEKIYEAKIYDNNVLIRNFIPCYRNSDSVVGMYDLVNNLFYTNQGTGSFTYGSVAPTPDAPIEIQSATGTQNVVISGKNLAMNNEITDLLQYANFVNRYSTGESKKWWDNIKDLPKGVSLVANWDFTSDGTPISGISGIRITFYFTDETSLVTNKGTSFILPTDKTLDFAYVYGNQQATSCKWSNIQIEKNTSPTPYQPYITPVTKTVELSSKNLFDKDNANIINNKYLNADGTLSNNNDFGISDYIKVKENFQYAIQPYKGLSASVCFYDKNKTYISGITLNNVNPYLTTPANCVYLRTSFRKADINIFQLEKGSTATSYVPYYNYKLNEIETYKDYILGTPDNWVLHKNIGSVVLNGTESWTDFGLDDTNFRATYNVALPNILTPPSNPAKLISNYFKAINRDNAYAKTEVGIAQFGSSLGKIFICAPNSILNSQTVDRWKNWLSTHNTEVLYPLATEETETITEEPLVSQLNELYYAQSYNDTTNIDVTGNLPIKITASAIKGA